MRTPTVPNTLAAALERYAAGVETYHMEQDSPGVWAIWVSLKPGWICPEMECGTIHETSSREAVAKLKTIRFEGLHCPFCDHPFDIEHLGRYGCPNCEGVEPNE